MHPSALFFHKLKYENMEGASLSLYISARSLTRKVTTSHILPQYSKGILKCHMKWICHFPFYRPVHGVGVGRECAVVLEVDHGDGGGVVAHEPSDGEADSRDTCSA